MRPTGALHIGHYLGALKNWVALQEEYDCYFAIVDWHALAGQGYNKSREIEGHMRELALDWIASGIDPEKSSLFIQSQVKEHAELFVLLAMITPTPWLIRNPAIKEQARDMGLIRSEEDMIKIDYGYLGYPVLQAADVLVYRAAAVPVGKDQDPHIEMTREIVRRFNHIFKIDVFPEPKTILTETPRLAGIDGKKMSKSLNNAIYLKDGPKAIKKKVNKMVTDKDKVYMGDPGNPEVCSVFEWQKIFNAGGVERIAPACRSGELGCGHCKGELAERIAGQFADFRERRQELEKDPGRIEAYLEGGRDRARQLASETMIKVRRAIGLRTT